MNIKTLTAILGIALTTMAFKASAQKAYTHGVLSYDTQVRGNPATAKIYFTPDSSATVVSFGAGTFKMLSNAKHDYLAFVIDVPVASIKKAGVASPAELEEGMAMLPTFTFTPTAETKQISGFNCKKVVAKENKTGKSYDIWITNDITVPATAFPYYYNAIGGVPIQYTSFFQGQELAVTIKSVTDDSAPAGTYAISSDFEKVTMEELMSH